MVMATLLSACAVWVVTDKMMQRLRVLHHRCIRSMNRVSLWHTRTHSIRTSELAKRLPGLQPVELYVHRRQLRWFGHLVRAKGSKMVQRAAVWRVGDGKRVPGHHRTWGDYMLAKGGPVFKFLAGNGFKTSQLRDVGLLPGWETRSVHAWHRAAYKLAKNRGTWRHAVNAWRLVGDDVGGWDEWK